MKNTLLTAIFLGLSFIGFSQDAKMDSVDFRDLKKIQVLNLGTFHMRPTPDENSVEFDNSDWKSLIETRDIANG